MYMAASVFQLPPQESAGQRIVQTDDLNPQIIRYSRAPPTSRALSLSIFESAHSSPSRGPALTVNFSLTVQVDSSTQNSDFDWIEFGILETFHLKAFLQLLYPLIFLTYLSKISLVLQGSVVLQLLQMILVFFHPLSLYYLSFIPHG